MRGMFRELEKIKVNSQAEIEKERLHFELEREKLMADVEKIKIEGPSESFEETRVKGHVLYLNTSSVMFG